MPYMSMSETLSVKRTEPLPSARLSPGLEPDKASQQPRTQPPAPNAFEQTARPTNWIFRD